MKFLLIGGLGYIGQVLQLELKKADHAFEIIDNDILNIHGWTDKLDITNYADFDKIAHRVSGSDVVVSMAAIVGDQACLADTQLAMAINCQGIQHIVNLCNKLGKKLIHTSTCSIYGAKDGLLTEESQTFPVDFYGQTKYQQERYILENSKDCCVLRLGTAYGWSPRMRFDLVVNTFIAKAYNRETLMVYGGKQFRPFVHIRDVGRAIIFAAEKDLAGVYNLANENVTIAEVAEMVASAKSRIERNELQSDPRDYRVDSAKLLNAGFAFKWDLKKGVEEINHYSNDLGKYRDARYSNYKLMVLRKL